MSFELSNEDKKSLGITTVVYALLILLLFFLRFWPPADMKIMGGGGGGGIEMNFGDSDYGMGDNYKSEVLNVKDQAKATPVVPTPEEDVIADDNSDANDAVIPKHETVKKTPVTVKKDLPKPTPEKPKVSKNANDALSSLLGNKGGDGDDNKGGNKGSANGNLNSKGYYGNGSGTGTGGGNGSGNGTGTGSGSGSGNGSGNGGGNGSGSGYSLGNRKALSKPQPDYTCQEQGRVAVQVSVDRNGNTISVTAGVQGTTNTAKCLLDQARIAAMNTKWQPDADAPEKQVGKIIYTFSLN
ncbi:energy transducer TonB [Flavobacterium silvisoli]|uniref:Energy transducer TonB n=1 Tax=Flavobacterium silvisoli TaxID=2529433 RepID=A0A4Q9YZU2_9FLAO|nr:energy transducer TonB [Flavobacterium silvisoli]TBX67677.1 energy transducer TonB [Flavobacterium silvisoli]